MIIISREDPGSKRDLVSFLLKPHRHLHGSVGAQSFINGSKKRSLLHRQHRGEHSGRGESLSGALSGGGLERPHPLAGIA